MSRRSAPWPIDPLRVTVRAILRADAHAGFVATADENIPPRSGRSPDRARCSMARGGSVADRPQPGIRCFPHALCIFRADAHAARGATVDENIPPRSSRSPDRARCSMERGGSVADRPQHRIRCFPHSLCIFRAGASKSKESNWTRVNTSPSATCNAWRSGKGRAIWPRPRICTRKDLGTTGFSTSTPNSFMTGLPASRSSDFHTRSLYHAGPGLARPCFRASGSRSRELTRRTRSTKGAQTLAAATYFVFFVLRVLRGPSGLRDPSPS